MPDLATTSFAQIQRIPPAHRATWSATGFRLSRYWTMPVDEPLLYRRSGDYIDQFQELLQKSVADRLRTNRVWVFMSGGLDSPTLAATARDLMCRRYQTFELQALTTSHPFLPDEDRYAEAAATHLKIPIRLSPLCRNSRCGLGGNPLLHPRTIYQRLECSCRAPILAGTWNL